MMQYDVIIIGAGAAGLLATRSLLKAGCKCCLLEATAVAGGRVASIQLPAFPAPLEAGAEFVHGRLPLTLALLKEAGIKYKAVAGQMVGVSGGVWQPQEEHDEHWEQFIRQLKKQQADMTISAFMETWFSDPTYSHLRESVRRFAEGFDLADINTASILAVKEEWSHENDTQYRIPGGYRQLTDYLQRCCASAGANILFNSPVVEINYQQDGVTVQTKDGSLFNATRVLLTVSAGMLQSGDIQFRPSLPEDIQAAIGHLGFGNVIKFFFQFRVAFWELEANDLGFILSDEAVPTWWTQLPQHSNLMTGWLGGPGADTYNSAIDESLLDLALKSLCSIFRMELGELRAQLTHTYIERWQRHPFSKGGYSFEKLPSKKAKALLAQGINQRVFFAGEAIHLGDSQGTVEAALQSGKSIAQHILSSLVNG